MDRLHRPRRLLLARSALACAVTIGMAALPAFNATAQVPASTVRAYDIPAGALEDALNRYGREAGILLSFEPATTTGKRSRGLRGSYDVQGGLDALLAGTDVAAVRQPNGSYTLTRSAPPESGGELPSVKVRDTVEGETATSPVRGYIAKRSATATKTDTPIIETPQSISVITADRIDAIGAITLKDALGYTPGVATTTYGADSRYDWIAVRGFDAYSPGYYMDGLGLRNNGGWGLWQVENYGAERIEILRGPSSVLYGVSAPGGVVNVVSKRPTAEPQHEIRLLLGDHQRRQVEGDFSGPLDADGHWLYRVVGVVRDAELPAYGMPDDRTYIAPSLTWRPSENTSLTLLSQFMRTRAGVYTRTRPLIGSLLPTPVGNRVPRSLFNGDPTLDHFDQDQEMVGYLFEHRFNETWTVRHSARYMHLKLDYDSAQAPVFATINPDDPLDPVNYRYLARRVSGSHESVSAVSSDNQVQANLQAGDWRHTLLFGLDYQRTSVDQYSYNGGSAPLLDIYAPVYGGPFEFPEPFFDGDTRLAQTGVYVQDQIKWRDSWVLTLGGRYDRANAVVDSRIDGTRTRMPDEKFTGRAGVVYLAPNGWAPYFSYAESFAPTATVDPATGDAFGPESGRQYEAGVRWQPEGRNASYSAAVFDLTRRNYISYDVQGMPKQTGEISVRGLELEAVAEILPRLNLTTSYSYTPRAVVTASAVPEEVGKQATAVSRHRLSVWADYRFANDVKIGLGARYIGKNRGDYESAPVDVPGVTLVDAMIGYDIASWSLALNLRNAANKAYIANCAFSYCYDGYPRTAFATATYRW